MNAISEWGVHRASAVILIALMALFLSCGDGSEPPGASEPDEPLRIISMSPNITEIIYAIGAGDLLVGVTSFCDYPPEAKEKPRVGGVIDTNYEMILSLKPDIVIDLQSQTARIDKLEKLGLTTFIVANETIDDVLMAIDELGDLLEKSDKASGIKSRLIRNLGGVESKVEDLDIPTVAYVIGHSPGALQDVIVAGSDNFVNEALVLAGGSNVFAGAGTGYPYVGLEAFIKFDPDFIFDATEKGEDVYSGITQLKAVRDGHVFFCFDHIIQIPGPRLHMTVEYFAKSLHPEAFEE